MKKLETYYDLLTYLQSLTPEQLGKEIHVTEGGGSDSPVVEPHHAYAIGTVEECEFDGWRSTVDNKYHADDIVILIDGNPFAEDGAIAYGGPEFETPIYGADGPTPRETQWKPGVLGEPDA